MPDERIAGRYDVERLVGAGGMARVYRARDQVLERAVAVKVLHEHYAADEAFVRRFRDEARSAARLSHPNVVRVLDRGQDEGREYIVFEYVEGETLRDLLDRTGPLPLAHALSLGLDVARALEHAHANGVVHRDVKAQNVLVGPDGHAHVADFGVARSLHEPGHTESGAVVGTPSSLSPEQARGERAGPPADVYGLGVLLYELLAGEAPFQGESLVAVAMRHLNERPDDVREHRPECPPRIASLVDRCLAKLPEERPTAAEVARLLRDCLDDLERGAEEEQTVVLAPSRAPRPERRRRRRRPHGLRLALLAAAVAAVVAALAIVGDEGGGGSPVALQAVAAYDPEGDGTENDSSVPLATDGDPATAWSTEGYDDFAALKTGVGIVLDARVPVRLRELTVTTDLPGFRAEVRAGDSPDAFSETVSSERTVRSTTTFELDGGEARYYLLWLTALVQDGDRQRAHVNEVTARGG